MEFDPIQSRKSAADLDRLANRLEADLHSNLPALNVDSAGLDEVSVRAAETLGSVANSYDESATQGIHEIRKLAAALRSQSDLLVRMDDDNASEFNGSS
ncbi:PE domain-containing protein [Nocardia sp. NBC_00403]|uniref:PE domain-containing protein n=1 Tax=Nocardia sp. NBC_00403 TaxID=2975990 RepID=UPI002E1F951A